MRDACRLSSVNACSATLLAQIAELEGQTDACPQPFAPGSSGYHDAWSAAPGLGASSSDLDSALRASLEMQQVLHHGR
jgi:hypothetical protein